MAATPEMKKKKGAEEIADIINSILEQASKSRRGFTPETMAEFYKEGQAAREEKLTVKPSRQLNVVVSKKEEKPQVTVKVGQKAIEASIDLAERLELAAAAGKKLDLKAWVSG